MLAARHGPSGVLMPLTLGSQSDYTETVEALIEAGADISLRNEVRC